MVWVRMAGDSDCWVSKGLGFGFGFGMGWVGLGLGIWGNLGLGVLEWCSDLGKLVGYFGVLWLMWELRYIDVYGSGVM